MKHTHTPRVDARYWTGITLASVFGTNLVDFSAHESGLGIVPGLAASLALTAVLLVVLFVGWRRAAQVVALYWATVAVARTAGTAIGDWLAENKPLHIGLPASTLLTGVAFVTLLILWRSRPKEAMVFVESASGAL